MGQDILYYIAESEGAMEQRSESREWTIPLGSEDADGLEVLKALASAPRLQILDLLGEHVLNVSEIAAELDVPLSTANLHVNILEEAGLLITERKPATRGSQKLCTRKHDAIQLHFPREGREAHQVLQLSMPIGAYVDARAAPSCGLASEERIIGLLDDPSSFFEPERIRAQLLWFQHGYVEYRFPDRLPAHVTPVSAHLSFEACSEAPLHRKDWPSDITVWINGVEIGSWTSPADFGGQRGKLTPAWWETHYSQHGLLKDWQVTEAGTYVDGSQISKVRLADLRLGDAPYITVRIGVKEDARNRGGINIFGQSFGNYAQDISLRLRYV